MFIVPLIAYEIFENITWLLAMCPIHGNLMSYTNFESTNN